MFSKFTDDLSTKNIWKQLRTLEKFCVLQIFLPMRMIKS